MLFYNIHFINSLDSLLFKENNKILITKIASFSFLFFLLKLIKFAR